MSGPPETPPGDRPPVKRSLPPGMLTPEELQARLDAAPPKSAMARLQDAAEMWLYDLNERGHWIFRIYDTCNEIWARLIFRGVNKRAAGIDHPLKARGETGHFRFLRPEDIDLFAELLASFDFKYLPPHGLDRATAESVLRRWSQLPFGVFYREKLIGYVLVRLMFPRRAVSGIWMLPEYHDVGLAVAAVRASGVFTKSEGLPDYGTIPLDNTPSLMGAQAAGWRHVRSNRRFHVLLR